MKKDQERLDKQLMETQAENRRLQEPLQKARDEVSELQRQLSNYERDKHSLNVHTIQYVTNSVIAFYKSDGKMDCRG